MRDYKLSNDDKFATLLMFMVDMRSKINILAVAWRPDAKAIVSPVSYQRLITI